MKPILLAGLMAIYLCAPASAQEEPTVELLTLAIADVVPDGFDVDDVEVQASENQGSIIEPEIGQRFTAQMIAQADLYKPISSYSLARGNVTIVEMVVNEGQSYDLFGIAMSKLVRGQWKSEVRVENLEGVPSLFRLEYFREAVLVGSPEEEAVLKEVNEVAAAADAEAQAEAKVAAEAAADAKETMLAEAEDARKEIMGRWAGRYSCVQGRTDAVIIFDEMPEPFQFMGQFLFNDTASPGRFTPGSFEIAATLDPETNAISIQGAEWIVQPDFNWNTINLQGRLEEKELKLSIQLSGCGDMTMTREIAQ